MNGRELPSSLDHTKVHKPVLPYTPKKIDNPNEKKKKKRRSRQIEYIEDHRRRKITFSKRKTGLMKKAYELATLTGTQILLLVSSNEGDAYTFATEKLQPIATEEYGRGLIRSMLLPDASPSSPPPPPKSPSLPPPPLPPISDVPEKSPVPTYQTTPIPAVTNAVQEPHYAHSMPQTWSSNMAYYYANSPARAPMYSYPAYPYGCTSTDNNPYDQ